MKTRKIGIVCYYHFPEEGSSTNRILAYSKGLARRGVQVEIFTFRPKVSDEKTPLDGIVNHTHYHYAVMRSSHINQFWKFFVVRPLALLKTISNIRKSSKEQKFDYLFFSFDSIRFLAFFVPILKGLGTKLIFIGDEYPCPIRSEGVEKLPWIRIWCYRCLFRWINYRVLMTEPLRCFFDQIIFPQLTHIMPSITDVGRFSGTVSPNSEKNRYLCYIGGLVLSKDNIDLVIEAFAMIASQYPDLDFQIYGCPNARDKQKLEEIIRGKKLSDRVCLKGRADYTDVPVILKGAFILVNSQWPSKRNAGGFPTKVGEYLSSGKPAVFSAVGGIPLLVKDGVNGYLVPPCDPDAYAEKLRYIVEHYDEALQVGKRGREYIEANYSEEKVAGDLKDFLDAHLDD